MTNGDIGFRVGEIDGRLRAVEAATGRIEGDVKHVVEDVAEIKTTMDHRHKADTARRQARAEEEADSKRRGRRDLITVGGSIVVAIIGAVALLLTSGTHP